MKSDGLRVFSVSQPQPTRLEAMDPEKYFQGPQNFHITKGAPKQYMTLKKYSVVGSAYQRVPRYQSRLIAEEKSGEWTSKGVGKYLEAICCSFGRRPTFASAPA